MVDICAMASEKDFAQVDDTSKTLLNIPWDARHQILRRLLLVDCNLVETSIQNIFYTDNSRGDGFEDWKDARKFTAIRCELPGLHVLEACRQLYDEGLDILLHQNRFVAIVGRKSQIVCHLRGEGMYA